ncbi:MAG: Gfo/Idh/MocA family oxidoreductase [Pirellulales bacterium]|nr:Gfo/Idh/MocA family oxidoreductase [Pirellulales bacterium]
MSYNRRQFLSQAARLTATAGAAAGLSTLGVSVPYFSSAVAFAAESKNDRHVIGCIGTGDRWKQIIKGAMNFGDVAAVCDVDRRHVEEGRAVTGGKAEMFEDYRRVLDNPKIDVVTIVTPDHWHSKIAVEAMRAGKDVYCEKPLTLTIDEGKIISRVQKETGRVFQVGTQQRSEMSGVDETGARHAQQFLKAVGIAHAGRLGKIKRVHCFIGGAPTCDPIDKAPVPDGLNWEMWLGQAPLVDFIYRPGAGFGNSRCHYEFRWWYEYSGGKLTDWGAHHVDIATWLIGMDQSGPTSVTPVMAVHPCKFKDGYPTVDNVYNTATEFKIKCAFPNDIEMIIRHHPSADMKLPEGNGVYVEGEKGNLFVSRSKLMGPAAVALKTDPLPDELLAKLYKGKKPGNHMANFFECVRDRGEPVSDVHTHHRAMTTCHLANIAIRLDRPLAWDAAREQITGDAAANEWLKREQRKGYEIEG